MAYGNTPPPGWMPPSAPRPGVIPLQPLGLGDVLGGAFATMGRYWKPLFGIAVAVYGAATAVVAVALAVAYGLVGDHLDRVMDVTDEQTPAWDDTRPLLIAFIALWLLAGLSMLLATAMIYASCPAVLQDAVLGRPATFGTVWRRAWSRVPAVIGALFLTALVFLIPLVLFVTACVALVVALATQDSGSFILPPLAFLGSLATAPLGIWLWVKFSLAPAAAVFERQGPIAAMRRSAQLVRGVWWRIFGISLLGTVIAAVASYAIQLPLNLLGILPGSIGASDLGTDPTASQVLVAMGGLLIVMAVGQLIAQIFSATFPQLVVSLLYVDQRIRGENLAPALAEAAAVPPTRYAY